MASAQISGDWPILEIQDPFDEFMGISSASDSCQKTYMYMGNGQIGHSLWIATVLSFLSPAC